MTEVRVERLVKQFAGTSAPAVDSLDLTVAEGEMLVLLGSSGCGKTTTLRCLAGLETPTGGAISIGSRTVYDCDRRVNEPPEDRHLGMVFQSYALWPHKTVRGNIEYPLKVRKLLKNGETRGWVEEAAQMVECGHLLDRYPAQLSGGQQQRVALARGLVARPDLVLFDEPLSNLDARLRDQVREDIRLLHQQLGFTGVYVTHDQTEALAIGTRIAVMRNGRIEQIGSPKEVFDRPATDYVAGFVGFLNRFELVRDIDGWMWEGSRISSAGGALAEGGRHVVVRARPEDLRLSSGEPLPGPGQVVIQGLEVMGFTYLGRVTEFLLERGGQRVRCVVPSADSEAWPIGSLVNVGFQADTAPVYPIGDTPAVEPVKVGA